MDDFLITAKDPMMYMKQLQETSAIKKPGIPSNYLGALNIGTPEGHWSVTWKVKPISRQTPDYQNGR